MIGINQLMYMPVGPDKVHMLLLIEIRLIAVQRAPCGGIWRSRGRRQVGVRPVVRINQFADMAVAADIVDMLLAIEGSLVAVKGASWRRWYAERADRIRCRGDVAGVIVLQGDAAFVSGRQRGARQLVQRNPVVDQRLRRILPVVNDARHLPTGVDSDHVLLNRTGFIRGRVRVKLKTKASARDYVGRDVHRSGDTV